MYILSTWRDGNGDLCVSHIRRHKIKGLYSKWNVERNSLIRKAQKREEGANAGIESDIAFCDFYFKADFRIVIALN